MWHGPRVEAVLRGINGVRRDLLLENARKPGKAVGKGKMRREHKFIFNSQ